MQTPAVTTTDETMTTGTEAEDLVVAKSLPAIAEDIEIETEKATDPPATVGVEAKAEVEVLVEKVHRRTMEALRARK